MVSLFLCPKFQSNQPHSSLLIAFAYQNNLNFPLELMIIILNNSSIETTQRLSNYHEKDTNLCCITFYYRI